MAVYVIEVKDLLIDEGGLSRHAVKGLLDICKAVDVVAKLGFTSYNHPLRRVYFLGKDYVPLWDIIEPDDYNKRVDTSKSMLDHIKLLNQRLGGCDTYIQEMEKIVSGMAYVKVGDWVLAVHINQFADFLDQAMQAVRTLYSNLGKKIEEIEGLLEMAEGRYKLIERRKWGDLAQTKDHNLIVDTLKPLQVILQLIEANV